MAIYGTLQIGSQCTVPLGIPSLAPKDLLLRMLKPLRAHDLGTWEARAILLDLQSGSKKASNLHDSLQMLGSECFVASQCSETPELAAKTMPTAKTRACVKPRNDVNATNTATVAIVLLVSYPMEALHSKHHDDKQAVVGMVSMSRSSDDANTSLTRQ